MNNKMKNGIFITLSFLIFFLIFEIIFSIFFIYNSNYHGPLIKIFVKSYKNVEIKNIQGIKLNKFTNKMEPGIYIVDNVEYKINSKGFRGEEFSINNKKKL